MSICGFGIRRLLCRWALSALVLVAGIAIGRGAEAATIYTYSFVQPGYIYELGNTTYTATLTGGFTGTVGTQSAFHIDRSSLSDFHLAIDLSTPDTDFQGFYSGLPNYFSFEIGDAVGGTLAFESPLLSLGRPDQVCVGAAVSILCNGGAALGVVGYVVVPGFIEPVIAATSFGPTVTLISTVTTPPVATTPIPGALLLFATALGGLGTAGAWRCRARR
jgi:hypothetical protein